MPKLNVGAISAAEAEPTASLPEPTVVTEVNQQDSTVTVTITFPLDYDDSLAFKRKKSLIVGETSKPIPVTFDMDGEKQVLALDGNPFRVAATLSVYQEDVKKEEETATNEGTAEAEGATAPTE